MEIQVHFVTQCSWGRNIPGQYSSAPCKEKTRPVQPGFFTGFTEALQLRMDGAISGRPELR